MLYGKILRRPSYGAKLTDVNTDAAKAMDGVVVRDGDFVGVAAPNTSIAKAAIKSIEDGAKWDQPPHPSSRELFEYLKKNTKGGMPSNPFADEVSGAAKSLRAEYHVPYVQHTPMEPRAAVAEWDENGKVTVWTATQNPFGVRREIASAFHIDEDKVRVIVPDFGGGFGGKHTGETAVEAARLAQAAKKPVAVRWTRAEEFTWAYFRPAAVIECEASLDASGKLTSWHFVNINAGRPGVESPYRCEKKNEQAVDSAPPLRHGSYRALAATANNFARESFIDELAAAAGKDPLQFRLDHIESDRLRAVLEEATKQFGWGSGSAKGVGLACAMEKGSFVATCAQVEVDSTNTVRVKRIVQAFECGAITNPSNLQSQNMGAIIQGLGPALREAMTFEDGKIQNASLWKYEVPRQADVPVIEVHLVNRPDLPSAGAGETPLITLAPAINNAIFGATQKRLRALPLKLA
jgi:isoquinoline 1-oxidoreductase